MQNAISHQRRLPKLVQFNLIIRYICDSKGIMSICIYSFYPFYLYTCKSITEEDIHILIVRNI